MEISSMTAGLVAAGWGEAIHLASIYWVPPMFQSLFQELDIQHRQRLWDDKT